MGAFASVLAFVPPNMASPPPPRTSLHSVPPPTGATQLTSSSSASIRPPMNLAGTKRALLLGGVAAVGLLIGFSVIASRFSRSGADSTSGIVQPAPLTASQPSAAAAAVDLPPAPQASAASEDPLPPLVTAAPKGAPPARPAATPRSAPVRSPATAGPSGGAAAAPGQKPSAFLPASTPAASPPDPCNPPYRMDFFGNKVLKPGCTSP